MEKGTKDNPHTILSSMEDIVVKAKEHGLDDIFYSEAENSMKRLSRALLMSKEETLILSLFFERCGFSRIRLSDIADMIHTSNIRLLAMMNVADELAKKGYLKVFPNNLILMSGRIFSEIVSILILISCHLL